MKHSIYGGINSIQYTKGTILFCKTGFYMLLEPGYFEIVERFHGKFLRPLTSMLVFYTNRRTKEIFQMYLLLEFDLNETTIIFPHNCDIK